MGQSHVSPSTRTVLWLLLLVGSGSAVEITKQVMEKLVQDFYISKYLNPDTVNRSQWAFLIGLTSQQCVDHNIVRYSPDLLDHEGYPAIDMDPGYFTRTAGYNYVAVFPNSGDLCSEYKILKALQEGQSSAAQQLATQLGSTELGCVVFYTTNSPCLSKCFSQEQSTRIDTPLGQEPFTTWMSKGVNLYFVYSEYFGQDVRKQAEVKAGLRNVRNLGYQVHTCPYQPSTPCPECLEAFPCNNCREKYCTACSQRAKKCAECQKVRQCEDCRGLEETCSDCKTTESGCKRCGECWKRRGSCKECKNIQDFCNNCKETSRNCNTCQTDRENKCKGCSLKHKQCRSCVSQRVSCSPAQLE
ncbi:uncharacterized protein LOC136764428 [Amia ocellicauda]|uniref:uncharacterized protein LOC136764428 n=1 Tax=Amia ocellicauda TaxID=2972642 RepID=UPI00346472AE